MSFSDVYKTLPEVQRALADAGLECSNLIVGIDFTKSNEWTGKHSFGGRSLHAIGGQHPNPYEQVLAIVGRTLASFDDDNLIPCFGFGDATTNDKHVFSFHAENRPCHGFKEALARYRQIAPHVRLYGPTSFAPIIHTAVDIVEASGGQYHVLVIIADGQMTRSVDTPDGVLSPQEQATVDAIVTASSYALSIVLVGVGDGPWDMMHQFDDDMPARAFDNFQFINFTEVMMTRRNDPPELKEAQFALGALMEIPPQYRACVRLGHLGRRTGSSPTAEPLPPPPEVLQMDARQPTPPPPPPPQTTSARSRVTDEPETNECPVCFHNKRNMAFNCGHQTCLDCAAQLSSCPICRVPITNRLRLY